MPPAPSDPEKYSIDEMMERLKGQPTDDPATAGELVTRADGSQALRVRKRKRRSEQPKREEAKHFRRIRMLQVAGSLVLLLLSGVVIVGAYVYANTAPYRKSITDAIANRSGASVEFKQFRVSPASANADLVDLEWPEGSTLKAIRLNGVAANISPLSLFGSNLRGDEVTAREGSLYLQIAGADSAVPAPPASAAQAARIPVQFNRISVPRFSVFVGEPTLPALKITATEASLRVDEASHQTALRLYRGNLQFSGWPSFKIDRAVVEFHATETELILLRITDSQSKHGTFDLAGSLQPLTSKTPTTLSVTLDNFDLGELLGAEFGELISAKIDTRTDAGKNQLTFTPGALADTDFKIAFKNTLSTKVSLKGFPFLQSLVRTLADRWYEDPTFVDDVVGVIHRDNAVLEIAELKLEKKARMAIRATLSATASKSLAGTMEVGIPESVAELAPNTKIQGMLSPAHDGYRWLTLKIGGSLAHPSDNFAELYAAAKDPDPEPDADEPGTVSDKSAAPGKTPAPDASPPLDH
ncbi:MAG: hypothetical protein WCK77_15650 [Verrucomicrobiota bacterium]